MRARNLRFIKRFGRGAAATLLSATLSLGGSLEAQEGIAEFKPTAPVGTVSDRISLDLRSIEVTDALKFLAQKSGMNIVISKGVSGRVSLLLTDVPIKDVFDIILRSNALAYDRQGEIYHIMTEEEYRTLYGKKFSDQRRVRTLRLRRAVPEQAFSILDTLKSEIGRILVDQDTGTVLIMDTQEKIREMEKALETLEMGYTVQVFDLKYAKAKEVEGYLKPELDEKNAGYIKADERSNQIVVKTYPDRMLDVEQIIGGLDRKTREVLVDARIVNITLSDDYDSGIDWEKLFRSSTVAGLDLVGTLPIDTSSGAPSSTHFGKLAIGTVADDDFNITFKYLQGLGETKILANPKLAVVSGQEARVHVGTREAYVTTTTTTGQTTTTTAEAVNFIDVGIQMLVTPTINSDGYISMKIKPEVSNVVRTLTTPSKNTIPIVDTSVAETTVLVKNGTTIIIGGLRKDERKFEDRQLPFFANLPLLGWAFKNRNQDNERKELLVLITPHIVGGDTLLTQSELDELKVRPYREYDYGSVELHETAPSE